MKKIIMIFLILSPLCAFSQTHIRSNADVFIEVTDVASNQSCQGIIIENKILTTASCFCAHQKKPFSKKSEVPVLISGTGSTQNIKLTVNVMKHDLACRYRDPSQSTGSLLLDQYFFDIAILEILQGTELLKKPKNFPTINCHHPDHNTFTVNGVMHMISRANSEQVVVGINRFNMIAMSNQWHPGLELFHTGFLEESLSNFYTLNKQQDGSGVFSLKPDLTAKWANRMADSLSVKSILESDDLSQIQIAALATHGDSRTKEIQATATFGLPFYNVKKFLKKNLPAKYLSADCLDGKSPSGFKEALPIEIY